MIFDSRNLRDKGMSQHAFQLAAQDVMDKIGPKALWQYLYNWSVEAGYISIERLALDVVFDKSEENEFEAPLQVSFNLSKPELIAGAPRPKNMTEKAQCVICYENVDSDVKPYLRCYVFELNKRDFFVQYPPYPYCNGHAVVIEKEHRPQFITKDTITDLLEFSELFPSIYIASNTDKEGTGASVLAHRHYQAMRERFTIFDALAIHRRAVSSNKSKVVIDVLRYPCVAIRLRSGSREAMEATSLALLNAWREGGMHSTLHYEQGNQTMSFICRQAESRVPYYEMVMVPRTTTKMTRPALQCLKKEFVGIIEMCGFGILPGRLNVQLRDLSVALFKGEPVPSALIDFADFAAAWYQPARARLTDCSQDWPIMEAALYDAFVSIIADNSAYDSKDVNISSHWLDLAFKESMVIACD